VFHHPITLLYPTILETPCLFKINIPPIGCFKNSNIVPRTQSSHAHRPFQNFAKPAVPEGVDIFCIQRGPIVAIDLARVSWFSDAHTSLGHQVPKDQPGFQPCESCPANSTTIVGTNGGASERSSCYYKAAVRVHVLCLDPLRPRRLATLATGKHPSNIFTPIPFFSGVNPAPLGHRN
jgi:hypothetical protein